MTDFMSDDRVGSFPIDEADVPTITHTVKGFENTETGEQYVCIIEDIKEHADAILEAGEDIRAEVKPFVALRERESSIIGLGIDLFLKEIPYRYVLRFPYQSLMVLATKPEIVFVHEDMAIGSLPLRPELIQDIMTMAYHTAIREVKDNEEM